MEPIDLTPLMSRRRLLGAGLSATAFAGAGLSAHSAETGFGQLTCHVLDTHGGRPGAGMRVDLSMLDNGAWKLVRSATTVDTGRTAEPLMRGDTMQTGQFMLEFFHAEYFKARANLPSQPFYDRVVHFFNVPSASTRYHITLVTAPWGYTTFRWKE